jgi:hypothetical protein
MAERLFAGMTIKAYFAHMVQVIWLANQFKNVPLDKILAATKEIIDCPVLDWNPGLEVLDLIETAVKLRATVETLSANGFRLIAKAESAQNN